MKERRHRRAKKYQSAFDLRFASLELVVLRRLLCKGCRLSLGEHSQAAMMLALRRKVEEVLKFLHGHLGFMQSTQNFWTLRVASRLHWNQRTIPSTMRDTHREL